MKIDEKLLLEEMKTHEIALLEEMQCPVYVGNIIPPTAICSNGHSVCPACRQLLDNCPVCRCPFSNLRSVLLENMARTIRYS
jgi:E3 ubiquitin-protein ligase SIAH1